MASWDISSDLEASRRLLPKCLGQSSEDEDLADPEDEEDSLEEAPGVEDAFEDEEESPLAAPDPLSLEATLSFSEEAAFL